MQIHTRRPYLELFTDFVSEHRFRIVMAVCLVAIAIMVGVFHVTIGLGPVWAVRTGL